MQEKNSQNALKRYVIYLLGLMILALGITLNTKTGFGVSPIISIPFCVSQISGVNLGVMTFVFYTAFVVLQLLLLGKKFPRSQYFQVVVSLITSVFINGYNLWIPQFQTMLTRIAGLILAIVLTGIGAAITVGMQLVPNPADGLADVIGQKLKKDFGFGKNVFDLSCIVISLMIGFVMRGKVIGIGAGTICAMIFTGRVIAFCRYLLERVKIEKCRMA